MEILIWLAFMDGMWGSLFMSMTKNVWVKVIIALVMIILFGIIVWRA